MNSGLKNSKTSYNFLKQEFEEYKTKATKTLQAKDRLIATLKESASLSNDNESSLNSSSGGGGGGGLNLKSIEIDELKLERDSLREELNSKNISLETLRTEMMVKKNGLDFSFKYLRILIVINCVCICEQYRNLNRKLRLKLNSSKIN